MCMRYVVGSSHNSVNCHMCTNESQPTRPSVPRTYVAQWCPAALYGARVRGGLAQAATAAVTRLVALKEGATTCRARR
jgi:hypothetical protein